MAASSETSPARSPKHCYTLLLIGNYKVGKSSLLQKFAGRHTDFVGRGSKGIEQRNFIIGHDHLVRIVMHDSDSNFHSMIESYYKFSVGVLLLYAIDDKQSFDSLLFWLWHFKKHGHPNSVVMVVGNKLDLDARGRRRVSTEDGAQLARVHNYSFVELSAKEDPDVDAAIRIIACEIYARVHGGNILMDRVRVG